jgi:serine/threonine-protein kinase RsbW
MGKKQVLTVAGRYDKVKKICEFVAEGARQAGLNEDAVFHVELCCDEASTNIIEHAYGAENVGQITISYQASEERFIITLHDNGRTFNPEEVPPPPPLPDSIDGLAPPEPSELFFDNLQIGGLGVHFIRSLMDEVHFDFSKQHGNTLTMVKYISSEAQP